MTTHPSNGLPTCSLDIPMPPVKPPRAADTIVIPTTPPRALLVSMAMRMRHDFGVDKHEIFLGNPDYTQGMTPREREVLLDEMAQLYEEVAGKGFYQWGVGKEQRGGLYAL